MGESTCLIHSLSLDSGTAAAHCDSRQLRNPMHALGESVSFGRFMSDSLAWDDKWSNFSHKRYVEEAAKYSQPGSVAQKKAFFEDYYKKKALLAQEKAAAANAQNAESHDQIGSHIVPVTHSAQSSAPGSPPVSQICDMSVADIAQPAASMLPIRVVETQDGGMVWDASTDVVVVINNTVDVEQPIVVVPQPNVLVDCTDVVATESSEPLASIAECDVLEYQCASMTADPVMAELEASVAILEVSEESESERPLLKDRNFDQEFCSSDLRTSNPPPVPPAKPLFYSIKSSSKIPCPPSRQNSKVNHSIKENVTPVSRKLAVQSANKIKMSPKPLFSHMSRTPVRDPSRAATSSSKGLKDSCTPLRTPTMAPLAKKSTATPLSENKRYRTPIESAAPGRKTTGAKWHLLGSLENKQQPSPIACSPFSFRTEERAAKRKEKLELKFTKASQKVQLQTKLKDKAELELKKLRQTLCFRARPLPSFYKERKLQQDNLLSTNLSVDPPQSPRPQQVDSSTTEGQCKTSLPPQSSQKSKVTLSANSKRCKGATHPRSLAAMISDEKNSPNIQTLQQTK